MIKGLGGKSSIVKMKGRGIIRPGEEKAEGTPLLVFRRVKGWYREDGEQLSAARTQNRTRGRRLRLGCGGALSSRTAVPFASLIKDCDSRCLSFFPEAFKKLDKNLSI